MMNMTVQYSIMNGNKTQHVVVPVKVIQIQLPLKAAEGGHFEILGNAFADKEFGIVNHKGASLVDKGSNALSALVFEVAQHLMELLGKGTGPSPFLGLIRWWRNQGRQRHG